MDCYTLTDTKTDQEFLNSIPIRCPAVLPLIEFSSGRLRSGTKIVIILSNGKKYMGTVINFTTSVHSTVVEGELEVVKYGA